MKQFRSTLAACLVVFFVLRFVYASTDPREYPFSDVMDWNDEEKRKEYEKHFAAKGITIRSITVERPDKAKRWAKKEEFLILEKEGKRIGYGAVFHGLVLPGTAVGSDGGKVTIMLDRAEILYDMSGRRIFLISYRTEMSFLYGILWFLTPESVKEKYRREYKMEAYRAIFGWGDLGEGHSLDKRSSEYASFLLNSPVVFKEFFDKSNSAPGSPLFVPFDHKLFQILSP